MPVKRCRLDTTATLRIETWLLDQVRRLAARDQVSAGEWMRRAITKAAYEQSQPPAPADHRQSGWQCAHFTITASTALLTPASCGAGCEMTPVYEPLAG